MTTVVGGKKGESVAIAADSLVTFGDARLAHGHEANRGLLQGQGVALGAMCATFDRSKTAREIADLGCRAGCEYDKNPAPPVLVKTIRLSTRKD